MTGCLSVRYHTLNGRRPVEEVVCRSLWYVCIPRERDDHPSMILIVVSYHNQREEVNDLRELRLKRIPQTRDKSNRRAATVAAREQLPAGFDEF